MAEERAPLLGDDIWREVDEVLPIIPSRRERMLTIEPVVIGFIITSMTCLPVLQQYMHQRLYDEHNITMDTTNTTCGHGNENNDTRDVIQRINNQLTVLNTVNLAVGMAPGLIVMLILGPYSDKAGRRRIIIPPLVGTLIGIILYMLVIVLHLSLWFIPVASFVLAIFGGYGCLITGCYAYVADVTTRGQRMLRLVIIEICTGFGVLLGQILAGNVTFYVGFPAIMAIEIGIAFLILTYAIFFLPETVTPTEDAKLFSCSNLKESFLLYTKDDNSHRAPILRICLSISFSYSIIEVAPTTILNFYLIDAPLCWGPDYIGYYNGLVFVIKTLGSVLLCKVLLGKVADGVLMMLGCISTLGYYLLLSAANTDIIAFTGSLAGFAISIISPTIRSVSSKLVAKDEQGALFAMLGLVMMIASIVGSAMFDALYAALTAYSHGLVWILAALSTIVPILCVGFFMVYSAIRKKRCTMEQLQTAGVESNDGDTDLRATSGGIHNSNTVDYSN